MTMTLHLSEAKTLPRRPGAYLFRSADDTVIYVGKAKNLRARVSSYFRPVNGLGPAKKIMLEQIARLETILVRSETEALLLESTLIKKYRPKYNVILKDDKYFQYIRIALTEEYPSVTTVRRMTMDGSRYFGPYPSGYAVRQTLKLLKRLFPYKNCPNRPDLPCFDAQLGRCLGHDTGPGSQARYRQVVDQLLDFLHGHTGGVLKELRRAMNTAAREHDFEAAARFRDRLQALEHVLADQAVVTPSRQSFDVVGLDSDRSLAAIALLQVRDGKLVQRDTFFLQHITDAPESDVLEAFLSQYYSQSTNHPKIVVLPAAVSPAVSQALQLEFMVTPRGVKRRLLVMAKENAADGLRREQQQSQKKEAAALLALGELTRALNLEGPLHRIEMYDVSNNQGKHAVASMVVFEDGLPKPSAYRKFTIKNQAIPDDMHRLAEVLRRRFARHDDSGWPMPDLLILDGGVPQLNVVLRSVPGLGHHLPVIALAKEHEEIFRPEQKPPLRLPSGSAELHLIQNIRDEAHRFAIGFYRRQHRRESLRSMLDEIPGLGPQGKRRLLATFGTLAQIQQASDEELRAITTPAVIARLRAQLG